MKRWITTTSAGVKLCKSVTSAGNTHILVVVTVVDAPAQTVALAELGFISSAVHIIQQDEPRALSKVRATAHRHSHATVQLLTHHVGIHHVPVIVTHRAPCAVVAHLHPALTPVTTVHQLYFGEKSRQLSSGVLCVIFLSVFNHNCVLCLWDVDIQVFLGCDCATSLKNLRPVKALLSNKQHVSIWEKKRWEDRLAWL